MRSTAAIVIAARAVRGFGDGFTALVLPAYLTSLGFAPFQVGAVATATLLGSAALTLAVSQASHRLQGRQVLLACCALMLATGLAFSQLHSFWPLVIVAFIGTLNPSSGDVSAFLPVEQATLAHATAADRRTAVFARHSLAGNLAAAAGALSVGVLEPASAATGLPHRVLFQVAFALYGLLALAAFALYLRLPREPVNQAAPTPLGASKRRVMTLAAVFSLDSFSGGFVVQSLLALWLFNRFGLSLTTAGALFFWWSLLSAVSQLASAPIARRVGLVNTMVFTHIPANLCVLAAAFAPTLEICLALLSVRALLSMMDVPARTAYVMAVVTPSERTAAAGLTNIPRSLAAAVSPLLAGLLLTATSFAWPLVLRGGLGVLYDLILWRMFRQVPPLDEA